MKRIVFLICISFGMMLSLLISVNAETLDNYTPQYLDKGDMTGDDKYTLRDALAVLIMCAKSDDYTEETLYRADVNSDSFVTVTDAEMLLDTAINGTYTNFGYEKPDVEVPVIIVDSKSYPVGDYCYTKLSDALEYAKANAPTCEEERLTILFAPGVYRERITISTNYLTFKNMAPEEGDANITWYYGMASFGVNGPNSQYNGAICYYSTGQRGADGRATLITAHDFIAEDMMFENSFNIYVCDEEKADYCPYPINGVTFEQRAMDLHSKRLQEKGIAVWLSGADRTIFKNCKMDTHIGVGEERFGGMETAGTTAADRNYSEGNTMDMDGNYLDLNEICPEYEKIITEEDMKTTQAPILWLYGRDGWNPGGYPETK